MERELLFSLTKKDFKVEYYKASGKGGQNRNKRDTACRITHPPSGAVGICSDERSQLQNKKRAFERLTKSEKFKTWHKIKTAEISGRIKTPEQLKKEIDEQIKKDLVNGNIKIENG